MRLSISNIAWQATDDSVIYGLMKKYGYSGLEIAPTRIFPDVPYDRISEARKWAQIMKLEHGFVVPSMQSIWYGRQEKMFGTPEERSILMHYTKKAINFAEIIGCKNLVFGCPRNRNFPEGADVSLADEFFKEIGDYAIEHNTVIGMEANPPIYNTNYINTTIEALQLVEKVNSKGFLLNLDVGTMIQNGEVIENMAGKVKFINHVHISEPGLKMIEKRELHRTLKMMLEKENYQGYVSIEMGKTDELQKIENVMNYVKEIFK